MILKIDYNENNVISNKGGRLLLRVPFYAQYGNACHLTTVKGTTKEDFENNDALRSKSIMVGTKGGLSFD